MKYPLRWTALLIPVLLSACSGLLPHSEPVDIYRLPEMRGAAPAPPETGSHALQLRVDTPQASGMLASKRIVVIPEANRLSVYHGARWNQPAPLILRDRMIAAFRRAPDIGAVFGDDVSLSSDYLIDGTLDAFQSEYGGDTKPTAVIRLDALLIRGTDHQVIATRQFEARVPVGATDVSSVVTAFGKAADRLSNQVVAWALPQMTVADTSGD